MTAQCFLKFQSFNVEGLKSKLKDETFIDSIKKFDFITLVETWLPANPSINIEGYYCQELSQNKRDGPRVVLLCWLKNLEERSKFLFIKK